MLTRQPDRTPRFMILTAWLRQDDWAYHLLVAPHVLACALYCNSTGGLNGLGTVIVWGVGILFGLALLIGAIRAIAKGVGNSGNRKRRLPPEPMTDMSPFTASLLSGRNVPAYTAKVTAVTPAGITVRQSRCCARGHQSPAQAVAHANRSRRASSGRGDSGAVTCLTGPVYDQLR